jgi:uncharacterized protein YecT (DUF1311 family)
MGRVFVSLALFTGASLSALGQPVQLRASFDCTRASNSVERAICGDPGLAEWDGRLGQAFKAAYARLGNDQRRALLEDERRWIALRNGQCDVTGFDLAPKPCILHLTKQRIVALEALRTASLQINVAPQKVATDENRPITPAVGSSQPTRSNSFTSQQAEIQSGANDQQQPPWLLIFLLLIGAVGITKLLLYIRRRNHLVQKYGREIGLKILSRGVWQGMTSEQLRESWGGPVDIDRLLYKTKTKETWKYNQTGKNRFIDSRIGYILKMELS